VHIAVKGGGISAMPSMHLGAASIYVLAARRTPWIVPAVLFWAIIFVCSGYFGYHYWVDGIVAAMVASACWSAAKRFYATDAVASPSIVDFAGIRSLPSA
jgi:membrane-associated phospholipid phosphatase